MDIMEVTSMTPGYNPVQLADDDRAASARIWLVLITLFLLGGCAITATRPTAVKPSPSMAGFERRRRRKDAGIGVALIDTRKDLHHAFKVDELHVFTGRKRAC
jgi:hypothetical protein